MRRDRKRRRSRHYEPTYEIIDVHNDSAYVLVSFEEVLRPRDGGTGVRILGRNVQFWRREDGKWRVVMALTARSAPDEPAPDGVPPEER